MGKSVLHPLASNIVANGNITTRKYIEITYQTSAGFGAVPEKSSFWFILLRIPFLGPFCDLVKMLKDTKK